MDGGSRLAFLLATTLPRVELGDQSLGRFAVDAGDSLPDVIVRVGMVLQKRSRMCEMLASNVSSHGQGAYIHKQYS
jgi:hypothetical protein